MYIFFWFFKQLYYIFKRFTKHKLLLLLVFFVIAIFLFLKPSFGANIYVPQAVIDKCDSLVFHNNVVVYNSSNSLWYIIYPFNTTEYNYSQSQIETMTNGNWTVRTRSVGTCIINPIWTGCYYITYNGTSFSSATALTSNGFILTNNHTIVYANHNLVAYNLDGHSNGDIIYRVPTVPYIENDSNTITNFSFSNLIINCLDLSYNDYYELEFTYPSNSTIINGNIDQFKSIVNNQLIFNIPKSWITQNIVVRTGATITFDLIRYHRQEPAVTSERYSLGAYILNLTTQEEDEINQDSNKQLLSDINNNQQQTTQAINNLENTITDSNVEDNSIYLPTDNTNDITQEGLNGIFTSIYNAFCTGQAQDIVFPIPFTNKNITLQANYVSQMLQNSGASWVITIIQAFWWYLISRFIVTDITNKITKIKSGNIEDIENTNIKGDML